VKSSEVSYELKKPSKQDNHPILAVLNNTFHKVMDFMDTPLPEDPGESKVLGVSARGWIAVIIVTTVCILSGLSVEVKEPLYSLAVLSVGWYFGQKGLGKT
jgi:hypothetical protein